MLTVQNIGSADGSPQSALGPRTASAPLVSIRAYAKSRAVDDKTIRKAIAAGKIPVVQIGGRPWIDPAAADAAWARNRDAGQHSKLAAALPVASAVAPEIARACNPPSASPAREEAPPAPQAELQLAPLTAARIANTETSTAIKEITRRKLAGDLLEREEVERTWGQVLQTIKDQLLLLPDEIAPALSVCSVEAECRSLLMREVYVVLGKLSKVVGEMAAA